MEQQPEQNNYDHCMFCHKDGHDKSVCIEYEQYKSKIYHIPSSGKVFPCPSWCHRHVKKERDPNVKPFSQLVAENSIMIT